MNHFQQIDDTHIFFDHVHHTVRGQESFIDERSVNCFDNRTQICRIGESIPQNAFTRRYQLKHFREFDLEILQVVRLIGWSIIFVHPI